MSYGHGSENRSRKFGRQTSAMACSDHKIYIAWLESFDDCYTFPAGEYSIVPSQQVSGLQCFSAFYAELKFCSSGCVELHFGSYIYTVLKLQLRNP